MCHWFFIFSKRNMFKLFTVQFSLLCPKVLRSCCNFTTSMILDISSAKDESIECLIFSSLSWIIFKIKQQAKNWPLWYSWDYLFFVGQISIHWYSCFAIDPYLFDFVQQYFVINSIKGFTEIQVDNKFSSFSMKDVTSRYVPVIDWDRIFLSESMLIYVV